MDNEPLSIDNHALSLFKQCPTQYKYRIVYHLVPSKVNLPAQFGIAIHAGLDAFYKYNKLEGAVEAFMGEWQEYDGLDEKGIYSSARGALILSEYVTNHNNIVAQDVEIGAAVEVPNARFILRGRIDLVGQLDGIAYAIDHKTRAKSLNTFCIQPNYQLLGYSYMVQQTYGYNEIVPIMANLIKVDKYMKETVLRMTHHPTQLEMDTYLDDFVYWTNRIYDAMLHEQWARVGIDYICSWCDWREVCANPKMVDKLVDAGVYKREEWRPY